MDIDSRKLSLHWLCPLLEGGVGIGGKFPRRLRTDVRCQIAAHKEMNLVVYQPQELLSDKSTNNVTLLRHNHDHYRKGAAL